MAKIDKQVNKPTTLYDHIREFRTRLLISVMVLVTSSVGVYFFYEQIIKILTSPLGSPLYYNTPAGSFSFIIKICFMGALIITIPVIVYNLIMFARPAFDKALPKKRVYLATLLSTILAISGAIFAYLIILPGSLNFFAGFQISGLKAMISADNYLNFVTNIIITFIIVFQLPLVITFIDIIKPLTPKKMFKSEKWVILGSLVVALVVPFTYDLVTSLLIALPIIVLYNMSIVIVLISHASVERKNTQTIKVARKAKLIIRPDLSLSEDIIDNFSDELKNLEKNNASIVSNNSIKAKAGSEIRPSTYQANSVEPADWVKEKKLRKLALLNAQVHVFSDISRN
ncbi:MAG: twin-arginine translocase subunit TatC [Ignavibacteria bacterium]|nr:twin-arginine translocase subunit TatC [Ignavibacteria bacterium]